MSSALLTAKITAEADLARHNKNLANLRKSDKALRQRLMVLVVAKTQLASSGELVKEICGRISRPCACQSYGGGRQVRNFIINLNNISPLQKNKLSLFLVSSGLKNNEKID